MIEIKKLSFQYEDEYEALRGIDLSVPEGQFLAVLGHNGSGKSTLAMHLNGLLHPASGDVIVGGLNSKDGAHFWDLRQMVGMVFQNPDNQLIATSVEEDAAFGPENLGLAPAEIQLRVDESLRSVGMDAYKDKAVHLLSGGQKQRVAIAGVMAMRPRVLVLDEPTAMLDPRGRQEVIQAVLKLNREEGITVVYITHMMEEAVYADRVVVLEEGRIAMDGSPAEIFYQIDTLKKLRLDVPVAVEVTSWLRSKGFALPDTILTTEELAAHLGALNANTPDAGEVAETSARLALEDAARKEIRNLEKDDGIPAPGNAITLEHVFFTYQQGTPYASEALLDVSLSIAKGEFIGLIGHTGSGKSTLIQHANGLLFPLAGKVTVDGMPVEPKSKELKEIRRRVGLVFQYPEQQLFEESVALDIAFGPKALGLDAAEVDKRVRRAMQMVELDYEKFKDASPFGLSGGEKRRVAIAGVLAMQPQYLILDEPCAGLDPKGREEILNQIRRLNESGLAVVLVSHSMDDIARLAKRLIVIHEGAVVYDDWAQQVFGKEEELSAMGLDVPEIMKLMALLREQGFSVRQDVLSIEEGQEEILRVLADA